MSHHEGERKQGCPSPLILSIENCIYLFKAAFNVNISGSVLRLPRMNETYIIVAMDQDHSTYTLKLICQGAVTGKKRVLTFRPDTEN